MLFLFGKRKRIKKRFKKDFGVELTNEEADKIIKLARQKKADEIDDFIQSKMDEKEKEL